MITVQKREGQLRKIDSYLSFIKVSRHSDGHIVLSANGYAMTSDPMVIHRMDFVINNQQASELLTSLEKAMEPR